MVRFSSPASAVPATTAVANNKQLKNLCINVNSLGADNQYTPGRTVDREVWLVAIFQRCTRALH